MEAVNVTTGLPWFYTIIVGSVLVRLSTFYWTIQQTRMTARVKKAPQIEVAKKKLEEAKETRDQFKVGMAGQEMQKAYKDAGVSMAKMVIFPLIQLPPAIGLFLGVKHLCALPVEQLTHSGFSLIPDLTLVSGTAAFDPYYILPLVGCVALNAQLKLSMRDLAPEQTTAPHVMNAVRVASPIILYFSAFFPAGLLVSISTGIGFSLAQAAFFRNHAIRRKLKLPFLVQNAQKQPSIRQSIAYGAKQANEKGWGKQALSLFRIPGLGEATATPVTSAAATQRKGKVAKTARSQAPKGNFMERPAPQK
ncbi:hypothetical protein FIBSPDRAFT_721717 [Athelia psychrophila]|uniref:Membrane insertase YidC/Oxa/ALB C-terminal domain-containing protein n=1 Tax=Athelia psychrophila TaxID=1759441 RepID=A0A166W0N2_9AGAM|nr:hypothetical protein FIBSPDRAFT_721717 [Fibularhizoctonia sp. CBS 109695]